MKTEGMGLSALLFVTGSHRTYGRPSHTFFDDMKRRLSDLDSDREKFSDEILRMSPISLLYLKTAVDLDLRSTKGCRLSESARRVVDETAIPESLMIVTLNASKWCPADEDPLAPWQVITDNVHPEVDYSSFDKKFSEIRVKSAATLVRGPKAPDITKEILRVPDIEGKEEEKSIIRMTMMAEQTTSKRNKAALRAASSTLKSRHDRAAEHLVIGMGISGWTVASQTQKDMMDATDILREINRKAGA